MYTVAVILSLGLVHIMHIGSHKSKMDHAKFDKRMEHDAMKRIQKKKERFPKKDVVRHGFLQHHIHDGDKILWKDGKDFVPDKQEEK